MLETGDSLPDIALVDDTGNSVRLTDLVGTHNLIVFFYPKDNTYICTKEACSFRDELPGFEDACTRVVGISADSFKSHQRFKFSNNLNYPLLSDEDGLARKTFGVGRNFLGMLSGRITYLFDKKGVLRHKINAPLSAKRHTQEMKAYIKSHL